MRLKILLAVLALVAGVGPLKAQEWQLRLAMGGTASVCAATDCSLPWLWNGTELVQVP